jgi:hypothetical protein
MIMTATHTRRHRDARTRGRRILAWLAAGCLLLAAGPLLSQTQEALPSGSARVLDFKGDVLFRGPHNEVVAAQRGQTLLAGSSVHTGKGKVLMELQDGSQLLVRFNSHLVLKAPEAPGNDGHYLELVIGRILATIQKRLNAAPSFKMGTPSAVITVRGTRFRAEVSDVHRTMVEVYDGLVEVAGTPAGTAGVSVMVPPGYFTTVAPDQAPEAPQPSALLRSPDTAAKGADESRDKRSGLQKNKGQEDNGELEDNDSLDK